MFHYEVFGGVLRSELEFPELRLVGPRDATWTLICADASECGSLGDEIGSDVVTSGVRVRMHRVPSGLRLVYDDTGCFDISADGRRIVWFRPADPPLENARTDVTSRVLAAALHAAGTLTLHASAVVVDGQALGFIAPKFHGKSTLALGLVARGARLLTDDTLPVVPSPATALPGIHAVRLWDDSADRLAAGIQSRRVGPKRVFSALPMEGIARAATPLAALYVLAPVRALDDSHVAMRTRVSEVDAALLILAHARLAPLFTKSEAPALFHAASRLARAVPVYRLTIVRDLDRLPNVLDLIRSWHVDHGHESRRAASA